MPLYRFVKKKSRVKSNIYYASYFVMFIGIVLLIWAVWPILFFQIISANSLTKVVAPISDNIQDNFTGSKVINENKVFTNPNLWFPSKPQKKVTTSVNSYFITIPKLSINKALVIIAGDDLKNNLIHYGGTALPGEYGNTVIFGHSTLPQLYNPNDYTTIFSLLPTLKPSKNQISGDDIYLSYNGVTYHYVVSEMHITKPNDLSPLEQRFDDSYLTLITCVPPGTYWERLNVIAKLKPI